MASRQPRKIRGQITPQEKRRIKPRERKLVEEIKATKKEHPTIKYKIPTQSLEETERILEFPIKTFLRSRVSENAKARVIELGCGPGIVTIDVANQFKEKVEIHATSLASHSNWRTRPEIKWLVARFEKVPGIMKKRLKGKKIDLIFSEGGILLAVNTMDISRLGKTLSELIDLLEVNGKIVFDFQSQEVNSLIHSIMIARGREKTFKQIRVKETPSREHKETTILEITKIAG